MLRVIFILGIYVLAPAALIYWAVMRMRMQHKPALPELSLVGVSALLLGMLMYLSLDQFQDSGDAGLQQVISEMQKQYDFPRAKFSDGPAVFGHAYPHYLEIRIYGVNEFAEQQRVVEIAKPLHRRYAHKAVVLNFLREEIWRVGEDGSRVPLPNQELSLRKVRLE